MTQKERLYREFVTLNNWIIDNLLNGNDWPGVISKIDLDKMLRICAYRDYTVQSLKDKIITLGYRKKDIEDKIKLDHFYETEHGKQVKKYLEQKEESLKDQINFLFLHFEKKIDNLVKSLIGENFKVSSFGTSQISISNTDENGKEIFGHNFDINESYGTFMINYPTFGQFNPIENTKRVEYLNGLVKVTNPEIFNQITGEYKEFLFSLNSTRDKLAEVAKQKENPYEL